MNEDILAGVVAVNEATYPSLTMNLFIFPVTHSVGTGIFLVTQPLEAVLDFPGG